MEKCERCGNEYDNAFKVSMNGKEYFFDSFECAISKLAPECSHCKIKIIGHGLESSGMIFCCANCANHSGIFGFKDHIEFEEESMSFDED
ncbi:MAG: hypothetical protein WC635_11400 [Bacteriovorax sp.]|jgi:YHS domain-containing protein